MYILRIADVAVNTDLLPVLRDVRKGLELVEKLELPELLLALLDHVFAGVRIRIDDYVAGAAVHYDLTAFKLFLDLIADSYDSRDTHGPCEYRGVART